MNGLFGLPQFRERRRLAGIALPLAALVLLAGCVETEKKGVNLPSSQWTDDRVALLLNPPAEPVAELPPPEPPPLPKRKPEQLAALAEAADDLPDIESLVGLDFVGTANLLGPPALDSVQAPARIWGYNGSGCVLSIFFYPTVDGQSYRALTYDVKGVDDSPEKIRDCFIELVREKRGT